MTGSFSRSERSIAICISSAFAFSSLEAYKKKLKKIGSKKKLKILAV
jgi:hypothetical protein